MPNLKIYADAGLQADCGPALRAALPALAARLMDVLEVPRPACQLALIWVDAPDDQPALNVELSIMPGPKRSRALLEQLGAQIQADLAPLCQSRPAIRISRRDAATFVALR